MTTIKPQWKKGSLCAYETGGLRLVEAIVLTAHRGGDFTVEARFFIDRHGRAKSPYLGYRYRLRREELLERPWRLRRSGRTGVKP